MSFIQEFFTNRKNNTTSETLVGQVGRLWYDPSTNTIRVSDGVTVGGIFVGTGEPYQLQAATTATLGGVRVDGTSIVIDPVTGVISSRSGENYVLAPASENSLGGVKIGNNLSIDADDVLSAVEYTLPTADADTLGGVRVDGSTIQISASGVISAQQYSLPLAGTTVLGGIKIGTGFNYNQVTGVLSAIPYTYVLPVANDLELGGVKIDNSTITIDSNGYISYDLPRATTTELGGVIVGSGLVINSDGVLETANTWVLSLTAGTGIELSSTTGDITVSARPATSNTIGSVRVDNTTTVVDPSGLISVTTIGIVGTVKQVFVENANGFSGTVTNDTTYPAITLSTTTSGILKGSSGSIVSAMPGVDYQLPITLTTNNTSGAATFANNTLNIPQYQAKITLETAGIDGAATLVDSVLNIPQYGSVTSVGLLSEDIIFTGTNPITRSGEITLNLKTVPITKGGTGRTSFDQGFVYSDGSALSTLTTISASYIVGDIAGKSSSLTEVLPVTLGGTGATNAKDATTALLPSQIGNKDKYLSTDGAGVLYWASLERDFGTVKSVGFSTGSTGLTASGAPINVSGTITLGGTLNITSGGTGGSNSVEARANLGAAASGANSDITSISGLVTPLSVLQGGTGANNPDSARANLDAAKRGANSDITSLSGLTTPLSVAQGGTGVVDLATLLTQVLPDQTGNQEKVLTTDGTVAFWEKLIPRPSGLNRQLQYNSNNTLLGTGKMLYDPDGYLELGSGSSDQFIIGGLAGKNSANGGTTLVLRAGDMYDNEDSSPVVAAGNVEIIAGGGLANGQAGYISFSVGKVDEEVFRITNTGAWRLDSTGTFDQVLMSRGATLSPQWKSLPAADYTTKGIVQIGVPGLSGLELINYAGSTILTANLKDVDEESIQLSEDGIISVDIEYVRGQLLPDPIGRKDWVLISNSLEYELVPFTELPKATVDTVGLVKPDGASVRITEDGTISVDFLDLVPPPFDPGVGLINFLVYWPGAGDQYLRWLSSVEIFSSIPVASSLSYGVVKYDNQTIEMHSDGRLFVSDQVRVPYLSPYETETHVLANNGEGPFWSREFPPATPELRGAVRPDNTTIKIDGAGTISVDVTGILPPYETNKFLTTDGTGLSWSSATIPIATLEEVGAVKPDGVTSTVDGDGTITNINITLGESDARNRTLLFAENSLVKGIDSLTYVDSYPKFNTLYLGSFDSDPGRSATFTLETNRSDLRIVGNFGESQVTPAGAITIQSGGWENSPPGANTTWSTAPLTLAAGSGMSIKDGPGAHGADLTLSAGGGGGDWAEGGEIILKTGVKGLKRRIVINKHGSIILPDVGEQMGIIGSDPTDQFAEATTSGSNGDFLVSRGPELPASWSSTLQVAKGGTGANDRASALNNLLPPQLGFTGSGILASNGQTAYWTTLYGSDILPFATSEILGAIRLGDDTLIQLDEFGKVGVNLEKMVTSVDIDPSTTGLTVSGGPITTTGTFTIGGVLSPFNGGTGATSPAQALNNLLPNQAGNELKVLTTSGESPYWSDVSLRAAGENTQLQYNSNGINAGATRLLYDDSILTVGTSEMLVGANNSPWLPDPENPDEEPPLDPLYNIFSIVGKDTSSANTVPVTINITAGTQTRSNTLAANIWLNSGAATNENVIGGNVVISGGTSDMDIGGSVIFQTSDGTGSALAKRVEINNYGAFGVGATSSYGTLRQVLTSRGDQATPIWSFPRVSVTDMIDSITPDRGGTGLTADDFSPAHPIARNNSLLQLTYNEFDGYPRFTFLRSGSDISLIHSAIISDGNGGWQEGKIDLSSSTAGHIEGTLRPVNGGTGLTTFGAANRALYSTDATTLTAGTLPVEAGGTNSTTKVTAFNNLAPTTTKGDLIVHNGTNNVRIGVGTEGYALLADPATATGVKWGSVGVGTVVSVGLSGGNTGLTVSVDAGESNPITGSGTFTLGGTLAVTSGGTGLTALPGSSGQLLFNNSNAFSATSQISYNDAGTLTLGSNAGTFTIAGKAPISGGLDGTSISIEGGISSQTGVVGGEPGHVYVKGGPGAFNGAGGNVYLQGGSGPFRSGSVFVSTGTTLTERLRITATGAWGLSGANYGAENQVLSSTGATTPPVWKDVATIALPSQSGNDGKYLKTNGTIATWETALPTQIGNEGKFLTTDGTTATWETIESSTFNGGTVANATTFASAVTLQSSLDIGTRATESINSVTASGTTILDCALTNNFVISLAESISSLEFTNIPAANRLYYLSLIIQQDASGGKTVTWPSSVLWAGGAAPIVTVTPNKRDIYTLMTYDGGTTWFGFIAGQNF